MPQKPQYPRTQSESRNPGLLIGTPLQVGRGSNPAGRMAQKSRLAPRIPPPVACGRTVGDVSAGKPECLQISLEHTRAQANEELVQTLQDYEQEESGRFDSMEREWEDRLKDPDDVFFHARDRKQGITDQIKNLQGGLDRLKPKRKRKHR
jgi:hypothetical protein